MARIVQQGVITTSGTSYENEPIIKSDGVGEVMQWQPSDGEADGIFIKEVAAGDKLRLGVGVELSPWAGGTAIQLGAAGHIVSADPYLYVGSNYYFKSGDGTGWKYTTDAAATRYAHGAGTHTFSVSNNTPAVNGAITWADALTIDSAGNVGIGGSPTDALLDVIGADPRIRLTGAGSGGRDYYLREQDGAFKIVDVTGAAVRLTISSAGVATFSEDIFVNDVALVRVGNGLGGDVSCTALGTTALASTTSSHARATAIGHSALTALALPAADNTAVGAASLAALVGHFAGGAGYSNTAVGSFSLNTTIDGISNSALGYKALGDGDCADNNTAIGKAALQVFTGSNATAVGSGALAAATSGSGLVAVGYQAGTTLSTHSNDVLIGNQAGMNVIGNDNTFVGHSAGKYATSTADCIAIGREALRGDGATAPTGDNNIAIGNYALDATTSGASNIAIGHEAGTALTTAAGAVAIGHEALETEDTSGTVVAIGYRALQDQNVSNSQNVAVGHSAGLNLITGTNSVYMGYEAGGTGVITGNLNVAVGSNAAENATAMSYSVFVGPNAGGGTGPNVAAGNTCMGSGAGYAITSGASNVLIGRIAGYDLTEGPGNILIGKSAGENMTIGDHNIAIGYQAYDGMTTADSNNNIAIGKDALGACTAAVVENIAIGRDTLGSASLGAATINLAIGATAGYAITTGTANVLIGHEAGKTLATVSGNTALGYNALKTAVTYNNTAIGRSAGALLDDGANNTCVGSYALTAANAGEADNTAIGYGALASLAADTADGNVALGVDAGRYTPAGGAGTAMTLAINSCYIGKGTNSVAAAGANNEIVIGYATVGLGTNTVKLGNTDIITIEGEVATTVTSDRRIKRDIKNDDTGLVLIEKLQPVTFKKVNSADYPEEIAEPRFTEFTTQELVTEAVEAAEAVYEDAIVQEARDAVEEETHEEVHPAIEEVTEERVVEEAREEIKAMRHKHSEEEVTETVTGEEIVEVDGKWVKRATSEEVTRTERTPLYEDCDLYNEDGSICTHCVTPAVEAKDAVVDEDGNEIEPAVEAVAEVRANDVHKVPVMEEYIAQAAQAERKETFVMREAVAEWTETHVTRPAEAAQEEVTERRLVSAAVEAKDAVYETVTVPADDRPADDDTVRLGLIAQDVQTAMTEAGVEFDIVNESPNGKLSLKYGNLVMPLIKAVQELSARVKTLEG